MIYNYTDGPIIIASIFRAQSYNSRNGRTMITLFNICYVCAIHVYYTGGRMYNHYI